jgi:HK97 gp10 family phage protein
MLSLTLNLQGFDELTIALQRLGPASIKDARMAVVAGAEVIAESAKQLCPVLEHGTKERKPGELRDSIEAKAGRSDDPATTAVGLAGVFPPAGWRAHFTEFGTRYAAPEPFLRPALDATRDDAVAEISRVLWAEIADEAGRGAT